MPDTINFRVIADSDLTTALDAMRHAQRCIDGHDDEKLAIAVGGNPVLYAPARMSARQGAVSADLRKAIGILEGTDG